MNWQDFLGTQGATIDADGLARFGSPAAAATAAQCTLVPLNDFGLIRFSGEETISFLHGQLSSDIKKLPADGLQYSSYSTPKGRMLSSLLLLREGDDLLLMLPRALLPAIQKRLAMYVMRSKTKASDASAERAILGLIGPQARSVAEQIYGTLPTEAMHSVAVEGGHVSWLGQDRFLLDLTPEDAIIAWPKLVAIGAVPGNDAAWLLSDIRAGILWVQPETQEAFVAQMANMELIGAVSFKKGCYPGQEIVARTQYLGKLKRRTFRVAASQAMQAGQPLYSPEMNGQACGQIAMAAPVADGGWEALAVVQLASVPQGVHLENDAGPALQFLDLPYAVHE
ncbi:YgfZ/GcvT domain-containing protein [Chitinimonas naiadis]